MSFDWDTNPLRQRFLQACWGDDPLLAARILDQGLSSPNPVERAYWLTAKANQIAGHREMPGHLDRAWDTLESALQMAPGPEHYGFRKRLVQIALAICCLEGPVHRLRGLLQPIQPDLRRISREPVVSYNIAALNLTAGRFRQARSWFDRALRAGYLNQLPEMGKVNALSTGAWIHSLLGRTEAAEAHLKEAWRLHDLHGADRPRLISLAMAESWTALEAGRLQAARSSLQEHMVVSPHRGHPLHIFQSHVVAARLAAAEGSVAGYGYYCSQARAICQENDMMLSLRHLQVIMTDTERKYGVAQSIREGGHG